MVVPFSQTLIDTFGWFSSLQILSAITLLMVFLALPLAPYSGANDVVDKNDDQSVLEALREAFAALYFAGYWFLCLRLPFGIYHRSYACVLKRLRV